MCTDAHIRMLLKIQEKHLGKIMKEIVPIISSITSISAIIIAVISIYVNGKRNRFALGIELFSKESDRFTSNEFIEKRVNLAKEMKKKYSLKDNNNIEYLGKCNEKDELIDFFQIMGILAKRKILNIELIHSRFTYWLCHYWLFFEKEIENQKNIDNGIWNDAEWLKKQFEELNIKKGREISIETIEKFIDYELSLKNET
jgi:hypothetical protein